MSKEKVFRVATFGGYNKKDVINYVEEMEQTLNDIREESDRNLKKLQSELRNIDKRCKKLLQEKEELEKEIEDFLLSKEALVQQELDAHQRAREIIEQAVALAQSGKEEH